APAYAGAFSSAAASSRTGAAAIVAGGNFAIQLTLNIVSPLPDMLEQTRGRSVDISSATASVIAVSWHILRERVAPFFIRKELCGVILCVIVNQFCHTHNLGFEIGRIERAIQQSL